MKHFTRLIALVGAVIMIACTAACTDVPKGSNTPAGTTPTGTAPTSTTPTGAEVYIDVTEAPTDAPTITPTDPPSADVVSKEEEKSSADDDKSELVDHQWKLSKLYKDGEERQIYIEYGSVVRQSGTYIKFNDDDTFECILGIPGCKGTYAVENGDVVLHITTKYTGKNEGDACDEYETVKWDHEADTLSFDFFGVTNVFTK